MQNPPARNSTPAPSFYRFTPVTFIVARDFFAKSRKLFDKTATSARERPRELSRLPLQLRLELTPGENFVAATREALELARPTSGGDANGDVALRFVSIFRAVRP